MSGEAIKKAYIINPKQHVDIDLQGTVQRCEALLGHNQYN